MSLAAQIPETTARTPRACTRDEYLHHERSVETKSEYYEGEAWPMVGASLTHIRIVRNLLNQLVQHFKATSMEVLASDMRVRTGTAYFYPDIVIVDGEPKLEDTNQDTLLNPLVIIEILSPSTEAFDRGNKFSAYRKLPSLQEYVLVSQDQPRVELFRRVETGDQWLLTTSDGEEGTLKLIHDSNAPAASIQLRDIYENIKFAPLPPIVEQR